MSGWISVKDRMPEIKDVHGWMESRTVLIWAGGSVQTGKLSETLKTKKVRWENHLRAGIPVTHWMPLPEPPK